jgi:hypothetical protein
VQTVHNLSNNFSLGSIPILFSQTSQDQAIWSSDARPCRWLGKERHLLVLPLLDAAAHVDENHAQHQSECLDCISQKTELILPRRRLAQRGAGPHHRGENQTATSTSEAPWPSRNGNKLHPRSIFSRSFWSHHLRSLICMTVTVTLRTSGAGYPQVLAHAIPVRMPGFEGIVLCSFSPCN